MLVKVGTWFKKDKESTLVTAGKKLYRKLLMKPFKVSFSLLNQKFILQNQNYCIECPLLCGF